MGCQQRTLAAYGGVDSGRTDVDDRAGHGPPVDLGRDRDRVAGVVVDEVDGAVDGVDDPHHAAAGLDARALLAEDPVAGPRAEQPGAQQPLGAGVEVGDDVGGARLRGRDGHPSRRAFGGHPLRRLRRCVDGEPAEPGPVAGHDETRASGSGESAPHSAGRSARGLAQHPAGHTSHAGPSRPAARPVGALAALDGRPLEQQLADHGHEPRVDPRGRHPFEREPDPVGGRPGLGVEVVDDLHVVGHEPDRDHHHRRHPVGGQRHQVVVDVRLQPRHLGWARPGAVDEVVAVLPAGTARDAVRDEPGGVDVLAGVAAAARVLGVPAAGRVHRLRDRVGDEDQARTVASGRQPAEGLDRAVDERLHEAGVVEVVPQPVEPWCGCRRPRRCRPRRRTGSPGTAGSRSRKRRRW